MDEDEHGYYRQFFDWRTMDNNKTNIFARLGKYFYFEKIFYFQC